MKMKKNLTYLSLIMTIVMALTISSSADGQQNTNDDLPASVPIPKDDVPLVPIPPRAEKINLNGTWNYKTSNGMTGTIEIMQEGKDIALMITSGATCRPVAVCSYTGTMVGWAVEVSTGTDKGIVVEVSNSVTVDKEDGTVTSFMQLIFPSNELATGSSTNHYVHPEGHEKRWNLEFELWRMDK